MANTKIIQRVGRCVDKAPIVIFGKMPRFQRGVKGYLLSRVKLLFVGFAVKWHNLKRAVQVLKMKLRSIFNPSMSHFCNPNSCVIVKQKIFWNTEPLRDDAFVFHQTVMHHCFSDSGPPTAYVFS